MNFLQQPIPNWLQWIGLLATLMATGLTVWAAVSAKRAQLRASEARDAAVQIGDIIQLTDLLQDLEELQGLLVREEFGSLAARANVIRGRIVRFKSRSYNLFTNVAVALDDVRDQLEEVRRVASEWTGKPENQPGRIQRAIALANEKLNEAIAKQQDTARGKA